MDKRSFLTANECTCTVANLNIEIKVTAHDALAKHATITSLLNSDLQAMNCQGVLGSDVDQTLAGANAVATQCHCLDNRVWVTLHDRAVHERTWVTFVGITNHILVLSLIVSCKAPLHTSWETSTTTTAQSRLLDDVDNLLGSLVLQSIRESHVTVASNILGNVLRIDKTAVAQSDTLLLAVEVHVLRVANVLRSLGVNIEQSLNATTTNHVLLNDFVGILGLHLCVESIVGHHLNNRAFLTEAETSCYNHINFTGNTISFNGSLQVLDNFSTARSFTASTTAAQELNVLSSHG